MAISRRQGLSRVRITQYRTSRNGPWYPIRPAFIRRGRKRSTTTNRTEEMSPKKRLHTCSECGTVATWFYMPSGKGRRFFCDEHVPRGCRFCIDKMVHEDGMPASDARVKWRGEDDELHDERQDGLDAYCYVDEKGRPAPCCEFMYCNNGFEIEQPKYAISMDEVNILLNQAAGRSKYQVVSDHITSLIESCKQKSRTMEWTDFIRWFRFICIEVLPGNMSDYKRMLLSGLYDHVKQVMRGLKERIRIKDNDD